MSEEPETTADFPQGEPPSDPLAETAPGAEESRSWLQQDSPLDRDDWIGTRVGQYEIIGLIGSGGMGGVYEARQQHPHRTVAIKIIKSTVMSPSNCCESVAATPMCDLPPVNRNTPRRPFVSSR